MRLSWSEIRSLRHKGILRDDVGFLRAVSYTYSPAGKGVRETHDTRGMVNSGRSGLGGLVMSDDSNIRALFPKLWLLI